MKTTASCSPTKWDEKPYQMIGEKQKLTKATVEMPCTGGMEGKASIEWLMYYSAFDAKDPHLADAQYLGLIRFEGKLDGKTGSFVMEDRGTYKAGEARSTWTILAGSGTGELSSLAGKAQFLATPKSCSIEMDYHLAG